MSLPGYQLREPSDAKLCLCAHPKHERRQVGNLWLHYCKVCGGLIQHERKP